MQIFLGASRILQVVRSHFTLQKALEGMQDLFYLCHQVLLSQAGPFFWAPVGVTRKVVHSLSHLGLLRLIMEAVP